MDDFVEMKHPNLPGNPPARVHRSSFETVWQKRGWVLATEKAGAPKAEAPAPKPIPPAPRPAARQSADDKE